MTEQEQRIAIAEAHGWKPTKYQSASLQIPGDVPFWTDGQRFCQVEHLPDYLHDLNAMHEAEATLSIKDRTVFGEFLAKVLGYYDDYYDGWTLGPADFFALSHATASQKAKAFLLTVNKWKE